MEQVRMFLAIALSFLVSFLWNIFFVEKKAPEDQLQKQDQGVNQTQAQSAGRDTGRTSDAAQPKTSAGSTNTTGQVDQQVVAADENKAGSEPPAARRTAKIFSVKTPLYTVKINEERAAFTSFVLNNYREHNRPDSPLKQMISEENKNGTYIVDFEGNEVKGLSSAVFTCDQSSEKTDVTDTPQELVFKWRSKEGVEIVKIV